MMTWALFAGALCLVSLRWSLSSVSPRNGGDADIIWLFGQFPPRILLTQDRSCPV